MKSTDDLVSNIKSSRRKIENFNRTRSSFSVLSGKDPILTIVGKRETIDIEFDTIVKIDEEERFTERRITEEQRDDGRQNMLKGKEEFPEEIRGVPKENCSLRKIQFSLQSQDQLTVPEVKRRLRSPPPFHRDLMTPFNEGILNSEHSIGIK